MANETNDTGADAQVDLNFFNIVVSLSQAAMVGMGKIANPQTGSTEKNMDIARINIDILQMLKSKTKGNLTPKENEILTDSLTNLQLTYADEQKKGAGNETGQEDKAEEKKEEPETEEKPDQKKSESGDKEESGESEKQ